MISVAAAVFQILVNATVGTRLLWLASRRSGGLPAWSCGFGFLFLAVFGGPAMALSGAGVGTAGEANLPLFSIGAISICFGIGSFLAFTLMTFRRQAKWAWALSLLSMPLLAGTAIGMISGLASAAPDAPSAGAISLPGSLLGVLVMVCFAWLGTEGMIEWTKSKKRVALGLSDPVVSSRFFMWGVFGLSTASLVVVTVALSLISPGANYGAPGQVLNAVIGLVGSISVMMAFFPSKARQARLRAKAGLEAHPLA